MAVLNIFVSFEYDKDKELVNAFLHQAKERSPHRIGNKSLKESYPNDAWKKRATRFARATSWSFWLGRIPTTLRA